MRCFSIRALMAFVLGWAVSLAALRNAVDLLAGMTLLGALLAGGVAMMCAATVRGHERDWWAGFALFAGGYLSLLFGPVISDTLQSQLGMSILKPLHYRVTGEAPPNASDLPALLAQRDVLLARWRDVAVSAATGDDRRIKAVKEDMAKLNEQIDAINNAASHDQFERVGRSLAVLVALLLGGMVATGFYSGRKKPEVALPSAG